MLHRTFKHSAIFCGTLLLLCFCRSKAWAVTNDYVSTCRELEGTVWTNAPSPMAVLCPIARVINVFVLSAAAFFVIYIFAAAIKYALAQGDPKALQGAQQTLTTAVIGFVVIIGVYTIIVIIKNVLGLQDNPLLNPFQTLSNNLAELFGKFGIN